METPVFSILDECPMVDIVPGGGAVNIAADFSDVGEACVVARTRQTGYEYVHLDDFVTDNEISTWMARPKLVANGVLPNFTGIVDSFVINTSLMNSFPQLADKLKSYLGVRFKTVITLDVSATPFHAGILRINHNPIAEWTTYFTNGFPRLTRPEQYVMPGLTFSLEDTTSVRFEIPWCAGVPYMPLISANNGLGSQGRVTFYCLTDVSPAAGTVAPTYNMHIHFEDVELVGKTVSTWTATQPQVGGIIAMAEGLRSTQAISKTLAGVSTVSNFLARGFSSVPALPKVFDTFGKAMRTASNYVSAFGFSKPALSEATQRVAKQKFVHLYNDTGCDPLTNLAVSHDASYPVRPVFGTDVNEMSIDYIAQVPGLINDFTVLNQGPQTLLYACALCPTALFTQTSRVNLPLREFTSLNAAPFGSILISPAMGVAAPAALWKSGFKFKFHLSKTKFHTGRLVVSFVPGTQDGNAYAQRGLTGYSFANYLDTQSCHRKIVDIRGLSEFEFEVPYTSVQSALTPSGVMGYVLVHLLDPIRAPATVPPGMRVLVAASMPDLELYGINGLPLVPTYSNVNQIANGPEPSSVDLGKPHTDVIKSVISYTKRPVPYVKSSAAFVEVYGQNVPIYTPNTTTPTAVSVPLYDYVDYIQCAFASVRGSYIGRSHVLATQADTQVLNTLTHGFNQGVQVQYPSVISSTLPTAFENNNDAMAHSVCTRTSPHCGVRVWQSATTLPTFLEWETGVAEVFGSSATDAAGAATNLAYSRSTSDDVVFGHFIGWPPMVRTAGLTFPGKT